MWVFLSININLGLYFQIKFSKCMQMCMKGSFPSQQNIYPENHHQNFVRSRPFCAAGKKSPDLAQSTSPLLPAEGSRENSAVLLQAKLQQMNGNFTVSPRMFHTNQSNTIGSEPPNCCLFCREREAISGSLSNYGQRITCTMNFGIFYFKK